MVLLENEDDESKYKLMFYKISSILSLKDLCQVVILERVRSPLLHKLPLAKDKDMIEFLGGDTLRLQSDKNMTCRCDLL